MLMTNVTQGGPFSRPLHSNSAYYSESRKSVHIHPEVTFVPISINLTLRPFSPTDLKFKYNKHGKFLFEIYIYIF